MKALEVTLPADLAGKKIKVASGAAVQKTEEKITLDINIAETLLFR